MKILKWLVLLELGLGGSAAFADGARGTLQMALTGNQSWTDANLWSNATDVAILADDGVTVLREPHAVGSWIDGCWADVRGNLSAPATTDMISVYGLKWNIYNRVLGIMNSSSQQSTLNIGAGGIVMMMSGPLRFYDKNMRVFLTADQSWNGNGSDSRRHIVLGAEDRAVSLSAEEGVTLTVEGVLTVTNATGTVFGGNLILKDKAWWVNPPEKMLGAKTLTIDGPNAQFVFDGETSDFFEDLSLANGASFAFDGQSWTSSKISVTGSSENVLSGALIVPSGMIDIDVAEGAVVDINALSMHDADGNAVTVNKTGKGQIKGPIVIGDTYAGANPLVVGPDEVVQVWGDGLTADVAVELAGGTLQVCRDGVIVASALTVTESSAISADEGTEGLFAGVLTSAAGKNLDFSGKGRKVFAGGATFSEKSTFWQVAGDILVSNATWSVGADVDVGMKERAGKFVIRDNGELLMAKNTSSHMFAVDVTDEDAEGVLEICEGGKVKLGPQSMFRLGSSPSSHGILRINGGIYTDEQASSIQGLGWASTAFGRIELLKGTYNPTGSIRSGAGKGEFLWRGGTYEINHSGYFSAMIFRARTNTSAGPSAIPFIIDGPDCVLDIYNYDYQAVTNNTYFGSPYPWYCTDRGCLTITNSWAWEGRERAFVVTSAFTNMNLKVCDKVTIEVLDAVPEDDNGKMFSINRYAVGAGTLFLDDALVYETRPQNPAVNTIDVLPGGVFDLGAYAAAETAFSNLVFRDGAAFRVAKGLDGSRPTLALNGTLTLPNGSLGYDIEHGCNPGVLITADSVTGAPASYTPVGTARKGIGFCISENEFSFTLPGFLLLFR